jgi:hypothetical protein
MHNNIIEPKLALPKIMTKARPLEYINVDKEHKKEESSLLPLSFLSIKKVISKRV